MNKWNNKLMFLSLSLPLSNINKKEILKNKFKIIYDVKFILSQMYLRNCAIAVALLLQKIEHLHFFILT